MFGEMSTNFTSSYPTAENLNTWPITFVDKEDQNLSRNAQVICHQPHFSANSYETIYGLRN